MYLCFSGIHSNAKRQLADLEEVAKTAKEYDEHDHHIGMLEACISAYHDALLALVKGRVDVAEIRDFMFHGKSDEEIAAMPFCGEIIHFDKKEKAA